MPIKDKYYGEWVEKLPSFEGKVVAITGTTSGTGFWAAMAVIKKGATALLVLNRESERSKDSFQKLTEEKKSLNSSIELFSVKCDLTSFESVNQAAEEVNKICEKFNGLHVLLNNAGISLAKDVRTKDGFEIQMQVNHFSHYVLAKSVMPSLLKAYNDGKEVRICQISSGARNMFGGDLEDKYFEKTEPGTLGGDSSSVRLVRYHMSKLANCVFAFVLHQKLQEKGYDVARFKSIAAEPGFADTNLVSNATKSHGSFMMNAVAGIFNSVGKYMMGSQSPADGSLPALEACFAADVESGDFYMPKKINYGTPFKAFSKCAINEGYTGKEKMCLDEKNYKTVWEKTEEACGPFFTA